MWLTSEGLRKLEGAERMLFSNAIDLFIDVDKGNEFDTMGPTNGHEGIFARLSVPDKYLVLRHVSKALLTDAPPPFRSAMLESAVYAIFCNHAENWECETPDEVADDLIEYYMENDRFKDRLDLPDDFPDSPSRADVRSVLVTKVGADGARFFSEQLADSILSDRDFELPPLATGDPRFSLMDIDPRYWSAGPSQLKALRKDARDKGESFGVVYWDLKASYLSTGFGKVWGSIRSAALRLEQAAPAELTRPTLKKHINFELTNHVDGLTKRAILVASAKAKNDVAAVAGAKRRREPSTPLVEASLAEGEASTASAPSSDAVRGEAQAGSGSSLLS